MYCPKCGLETEKGANFCSSCGRLVGKFVKPKKGVKTTSASPINKKHFIFAFLFIFLIIIILASVYFLRPFLGKKLKLVSEKKTVSETVKEFPTLENIETKFLDEVKKKASSWSSNARLYYFYASVKKAESGKSYISYNFFSPEKEKALSISKYGDQPLEAKEDERMGERNKIPTFPPKLPAAEAFSLAVQTFNETQTDKQNIASIVLILSEDQPFWDIELRIGEGKGKEKKASCKVFFEKKAECYLQKESKTMTVGASESARLVTNSQGVDFLKFKEIETSKLDEARQKALLWDEKAKLCLFSTGIYDLEKSNPSRTYQFCSPAKTLVYEVGYDSEGKVSAKERMNVYYLKSNTPSFPPLLSASEAAALSLFFFKQTKTADEKMTLLVVSLYGDNNYWETHVSLEGEKGSKRSPTCKIYFDKKMECES